MGIAFDYKVTNPRTKQEIIKLIFTSRYLKGSQDASGGEIYRHAIAGRFHRDVHVLRPPDAQLKIAADRGNKVEVLFTERLFLRLKGVIYLLWIESHGNSRKGTITSRTTCIQRNVGRDDGADLKKMMKEVSKSDKVRQRDQIVGERFGDFSVKINQKYAMPVVIDIPGPEVERYPNTSGGPLGESSLYSGSSSSSGPDFGEEGQANSGAGSFHIEPYQIVGN